MPGRVASPADANLLRAEMVQQCPSSLQTFGCARLAVRVRPIAICTGNLNNIHCGRAL
jgi:hypothetical protein